MIQLLYFQADSTRTDDVMYNVGYYIGSFLPMIIIGIIAFFMYKAIRRMKEK